MSYYYFIVHYVTGINLISMQKSVKPVLRRRLGEHFIFRHHFQECQICLKIFWTPFLTFQRAIKIRATGAANNEPAPPHWFQLCLLRSLQKFCKLVPACTSTSSSNNHSFFCLVLFLIWERKIDNNCRINKKLFYATVLAVILTSVVLSSWPAQI